MNTTRVYAATWLAMNQELQVDSRSQSNLWYRFQQNARLNAPITNYKFKNGSYPVDFIPQFVWITMLLDVIIPWTESALSPRVKSMEARGADLWIEAMRMLSVSQGTLHSLQGTKSQAET